MKTKETKMKPKDKPHYVNNKEFSLAVVDYCTKVKESKDKGEKHPIVPDYIASCFLKICEGLSHKSNFVRYTYREEMVMDAGENCQKAIENYNIETATRSGNPNAFAYFTQISWYAFLRRIQKEKKQQDIKMKFLSEAGIEHFIDNTIPNSPDQGQEVNQHDVVLLRSRIDTVKEADKQFKEYAQEEKKQRKRRAVNVDSDLSDHMI